MRDYIKEFKKQKIKKNVLIVVSSLAFAFVINGFLFWTPTGNMLQTSVKNYSTEKTDKTAKSDIYIVKGGTGSDILDLKVGTELKNVSELRFSVVSDPQSLTINDIFTDVKDIRLIKQSNVPGYYLVVIKLDKARDIPADSSIGKIVYTKSIQAKTSVNLVETNFRSEGTDFELQNSGIEF